MFSARQFYYPPAFAFRNTAFDATSLRHNVLDIEARYITSAPPNQPPYMLGPVELANKLGVRSIDASTILIDVDGTLTGVRSPATGRTSSVSRNTFYDAPTVIPECDSFGVNTSPFDLVTTVVTVASPSTMHPQWYKVDTYWGRIDKSLPFNAPNNAYGTYVQIPLYRQLLLSSDVPCDAPLCSSISPQNNMFSCTHATMMAGSQVWSAPMLTMNNMVYFVDTNRQPLTGELCSKFTSNFRDEVLFVPSQSYVLYQLYPQPTTRITYQVHVGTSFQPATDGFYARIFTVYNVDADSNAQPIIPVPALTGDVSFNSATGVLTVVLDNDWIRDDFDITAAEAYTRCLPRDICDYDAATQSCVVAASVTDPVDRVTYRDICGYWATRASGASETVGDTLTDCPANGCLAYVFRLPGDFVAQPYEVVGKPLRKTMTCTPEFSAFNVSLVTATDIPGNTCTGSPNTLCYQPPPDKVFVSGPKYCDVHGGNVLCDCSGASGNATFALTSVNKPSYRSMYVRTRISGLTRRGGSKFARINTAGWVQANPIRGRPRSVPARAVLAGMRSQHHHVMQHCEHRERAPVRAADVPASQHVDVGVRPVGALCAWLGRYRADPVSLRCAPGPGPTVVVWHAHAMRSRSSAGCTTGSRASPRSAPTPLPTSPASKRCTPCTARLIDCARYPTSAFAR